MLDGTLPQFVDGAFQLWMEVTGTGDWSRLFRRKFDRTAFITILLLQQFPGYRDYYAMRQVESLNKIERLLAKR